MRDKHGKGTVIQALLVGCFLLGLGIIAGQDMKTDILEDNIGQIADTQKKSSKKNALSVEEHSGNLQEETMEVHIPGLKNQYKFVFMSDLHIIVENEEISSRELENVQTRRGMFQSVDGRYAAELWKELPDVVSSWQVDGVLLGGDMIDFASTSNIQHLKAGIQRMNVPVLYVRADHDNTPYFCQGVDKKEMKKLHQEIDGYEGVSLLEFEDLCVVGINDSTEQISKGQLKRFEEIVNIGKPILLLTHVPLESKVDESLLVESRKEWEGRDLVWGEGCSYEPDETTSAFLELIYDKNSQVKAVCCGHLHFTWEGKLTENTVQHVFSAAYPGRIGMITVDGDRKGREVR